MLKKGSAVLIDGKKSQAGCVVQDGVSKSLVSTKRSDGQPGSEQEWYSNARLTVVGQK